LNFIPLATLGIMAREYEQSQFIALLQTLGPNTPVLPLILKGVIQNSSLSNRAEMIEALDKMSQPNPQAQEMEQMQQKLAIEAAQAQIAVNTTQAKRNEAEAMNTMVEAQLKPQEVQAKIIASSTNNLPNNDDEASREFDRRVKIADLMLIDRRVKIADLMLKEADINNKSKIVELQMSQSKQDSMGKETEFLRQLTESLNK
jgi:hypothetical protein